MAQIIRSAEFDENPVLISYRRAGAETVILELPPEVQITPPAIERAPEEAKSPPPLPQPSPEELQRDAEEIGYRDGYEAGVRAAKAELAEELERMQKLNRSVHDALAQGIEGLEDVMVEIAFAAACKVLGQAALTEEGVRAMVREAMREARSKEGLVLRISPRDYELLYADPPRQRPLAEDAKLEVVADDRVASGCLIETGGGTLDARLEVQLRQLLDTLTRARNAQADA
jgi:flagellar assembly protein FliH